MESLLFQKSDPKGVDAVIDNIQSDLFRELTNKSGWRGWKSYPRAYKNKVGKDSVIAEIYTERGEYKDVLFDDTFTVSSFFLVDDTRTFDSEKNVYTQKVSMIFQANLKKLFPLISHRADEELIDDIRLAIRMKRWENQLTEIITGADKVYEALKIGYDKRYDDISTFCVVRVNFKMIYTNTNHITALK